MKLRQSENEISTAEVPLAFQSALTGILLASEVVLDALGHRTDTFSGVTQLYPLTPIQEEGNPYNHNLPKDVTGRCLCRDQDFVEQFKQKWYAGSH